jgi:CheY-like chemotaxis protein
MPICCTEGWICRVHPDLSWPHDDCTSPRLQCRNAECPWWTGTKPAVLTAADGPNNESGLASGSWVDDVQLARVLIVDDDPATRTGLAALMRAAGYEPTAVGAFHEALHILRTAPPDLLITDVRLEEYNGLQLVINSPKRVPAIVITGFTDPVLESDARREGAVYIVKPVNPGRLLDLVKTMLAGRVDAEAQTGTDSEM